MIVSMPLWACLPDLIIRNSHYEVFFHAFTDMDDAFVDSGVGVFVYAGLRNGS